MMQRVHDRMNPKVRNPGKYKSFMKMVSKRVFEKKMKSCIVTIDNKCKSRGGCRASRGRSTLDINVNQACLLQMLVMVSEYYCSDFTENSLFKFDFKMRSEPRRSTSANNGSYTISMSPLP